MASVIRETVIAADPDAVWDALRDWGAVHERLAPGFVVDTRVDGRDRVVTFGDGAVVRELFLGADDGRRRLAWAVVDGSLGLTHYSAAAQVVPEVAPEVAADAAAAGPARSRFVWTADLLPDDLAATVAGLIEQGLATIRATLEEETAAAPAGTPRAAGPAGLP